MIRRSNLIPPSERPRTKTDFGMLGLIVIAVVVIAGIGLSYVYFNGVLTDRKRELEQVQAQSAQARNELAALAEYEALGNQRRDAEEVVQHIYAGRTAPLADVGGSELGDTKGSVAAAAERDGSGRSAFFPGRWSGCSAQPGDCRRDMLTGRYHLHL